MKQNINIFVFLMLFFGFSTNDVFSQSRLLRKMQEKTEEKIIREIFNENEDENKSDENNHSPESINESPTDRSNRRGSGLNQARPDVNQSIARASSSFENGNYKSSKDAVRDALWAVELGISENVLQDLPQKVENLESEKEEDRVTSTGVGFVGLIIERNYYGGDDMALTVTIGNDSGIPGLAGMYMVDERYMDSTEETNQKRIQFKDHRAIIRYDEYDGYSLSVPFGQSSVFLLNGTNFETEDQFMLAADNFDIDSIKKQLGEP
ncbi:MAG: hypothetical protein ACLFQS_06300 [Bacteroidales bacterium]